MKLILKLLGGLIGLVIVLTIATLVFARFHDGPLNRLPHPCL